MFGVVRVTMTNWGNCPYGLHSVINNVLLDGYKVESCMGNVKDFAQTKDNAAGEPIKIC
jgi:hypothetical protein